MNVCWTGAPLGHVALAPNLQPVDRRSRRSELPRGKLGRWEAPLFLLATLACTSPDDAADDSTSTGPDSDSVAPGPSGDPATVELAGDCPLEERVGGFQVSIYEDYSLVQGAVADAVVPIAVLEQVANEGECRLLRRNNPHCDPACASGFTCDFDGECIDYPANQDLGSVKLLGLDQVVVMDPVQPGNSYFDTSLPHPAFSQGQLIELRATEGWSGAWDLHGVGSEILVPGSLEWVISGGEDLQVTWQAPPEGARSHLQLKLNIDQHGTSPVSVLCELEDDGQGSVPGSLIQALVAYGVSGFPSASLSRRTVDQVRLELAEGGCFDLVVDTPVHIDVDVLGFTPCKDSDDCPDDQTCNLELEICQ